jgi:hypothetical protein
METKKASSISGGRFIFSFSSYPFITGLNL